MRVIVDPAIASRKRQGVGTVEKLVHLMVALRGMFC